MADFLKLFIEFKNCNLVLVVSRTYFWDLIGLVVQHSKNNLMSLEEKIRVLISNFKILKEEEVEIIIEKTIVNEFKKGSILLKEGQIPTKCYMVVEGCVRE